MYKNCFKRLFDFCIALCAFPFVLLVCIGVWIAIKCDDGGPLFHMASRIGKNGRIFKMYKFRSMIVNRALYSRGACDLNGSSRHYRMESSYQQKLCWHKRKAASRHILCRTFKFSI